MSPAKRRERLRLEIATALLRHEWAIAEEARSGATPALTTFIEESKQELLILKDLLGKLEPAW